jgi:BTB/POZ domain
MDRFEDSDEESEQKLSWRLDPDESLSDWTVIIKSEGSSESKEYHVHKNILAVGPCKSEYFASLFRTQMREAETSTSHITLENGAADAVPHMLDFMYTQELSDVTSEIAVSLRYLAQYFGIKLLHRRVMVFVNDDMTITNVHHYIQSARMFHDEKMLALARSLCIDNIEHLATTSLLLKSVDPDFFYEIISSPEVDTCSVSCHVSTLVAAYCRINQGQLSREMFDQLTDRKFIPLIDNESAMMLLELEAASSQTESSRAANCTCLQKRCIKVLAQHWKEFAEQGDLPAVRSFPPNVLAELFERSIITAKNDMEHCLSSVTTEIEKRAKLVTQGLHEAAAEVERQVESAQSECRRLEHELHEVRRLLQDQERELAEYRREWSRMVRVPVDHTFQRDLKRCTYHHQSGSEPFDNPGHHVGQYGKTRPTAMPTIGDASEDGFLFLQKSGHYTQRWPLFYYTDR